MDPWSPTAMTWPLKSITGAAFSTFSKRKSMGFVQSRRLPELVKGISPLIVRPFTGGGLAV